LHEWPFDILGGQRVLHECVRTLVHRCKCAECRLVDCAAGVEAVRALEPPQTDRGVTAPATIERTDRVMQTVEINLRLENRGAGDVALNRDDDRRLVD